MALRRPMPEDWVPSPRTKISTRPTWEPRDERVRIPKGLQQQRTRPHPIHLLSPPDMPCIDSPPLPFKDTMDQAESPKAPEIVDLVAPNTWPKRGAPSPNLGPAPPSLRPAPSPSLRSWCSAARGSEISFGVLDYYMREPSPLHSPDLPPPTPKVDPAMEQFDFQLPSTPRQQTASIDNQPQQRAEVDVTAGADNSGERLLDVTPPSRQPPQIPFQQQQHKRTYSLFPTIKETSHPNLTAAINSNPTSPPDVTSTTSNITCVPSHQQPDPSYRPRRESISGSIRSRKNSCNSYRSNRRIPLRILSSSFTATTSSTGGYRTNSSVSVSPPNGEHRSRWSEDTITSPTAATTPGPRTSFGSLLRDVSEGRDSEQYPACFFEDDDEAAPLRRKFPWKRSISLTQERQQTTAKHGNGKYDGRLSFGYRLKQVMLCGGCGSARRVTR